MISAMTMFRAGLIGSALLASIPLHAAEEFPFGLEMTLDAGPQPGSKRIPNLEIGDAGETRVELWCKGGKGQFSVAGNTVVFVAGAMEERNCPPARAQLDDELLATLTAATNWQRRGDAITFIGTKPLRFRLNTN
jgi:heat shock protein HslJ